MISKCFWPILCMAAALALLSTPAHADSDGSFCTGNGYLAYELYSANESSKVLRIVRFDSSRGIYAAGEVTMNSFQVHGLFCKADRVEISGWSNAFEQYTVAVPSPSRVETATPTSGTAAKQTLQILEHHIDAAAKFDPAKDTPEPHSFWYGPLGSHPLEISDPDHKYFLVISASDESVQKGEIRNRRLVTLVEKSQDGTISHSLQLCQHVNVETVD